MKILITGSTGYIGQRLIAVLLEKGHEIICCVRDKSRFNANKFASSRLSVIEVNFLEKDTLASIPDNIDAAYYLIHSMSTTTGHFEDLETLSAINFKERIQSTKARQVIYLSGIVNEGKLSKHLVSRKNVEDILSSGTFALTTLRAGIIVGSGSASFEIIRDLVEKLPVMVAPRWLNTVTQPIATRNVIEFLSGVLMLPETFNRNFDIGGPDILTYKQMLLIFARVRGLRRRIFIVPVMTPKLSSYWLYFVTSISFPLAQNLVDSMKVKVLCRENNLSELLKVNLINYEKAIMMAFDKIEQNQVVSSWKDALTSNILDQGIARHIEIPQFGCFKDIRKRQLKDPGIVLEKVWSIGGGNGWYYANWLWNLRGFIDKLAGGVGIRRGRKHPSEIFAGETLDFWRVLLADKNERRLLLYAEMKLPGEAWLEFRIDKEDMLYQTASFRPSGISGRLYWYLLLPVHIIIFKGMISKISRAR